MAADADFLAAVTPTAAELLKARRDREAIARAVAQGSFIDFIRAVAPWFIVEEIHLAIAEKLEAVAEGLIDRLMIFMPPRAGKPVEVSTPVLCGDGLQRRLDEIKVGDTVVTDKGRARRVTAVHVQGLQPCVTITTASGREVTAAVDHPFLTAEGWKEAGYLDEDDVLAIPSIFTCPPGAGEEPVERFRLAGYFVGDGNTTASGAGPGMINAAISCFDPELRPDIEHCIRESGFEVGISNERLVTARGGVRPWLRAIGLAGKRSIHKRVPEFVFRGGREGISAFIGALFATDGTIFKKSAGRKGYTVEFGLANKPLLEDVRHLLSRLGIRSALRRKNGLDQNKNPYESWRLSLYSREDVTRFIDAVPVYGVKAARLAESRQALHEFDAPYRPDPIVAIADAGMRECRCLTVEEDHTFLANDLVVHNSQMVSIFFPAWYMGRFPDRKVMQISYSVELAMGFGRQVRDLVKSPEYQYIFPGVELKADNNAAGRWALSKRGEYFAAGTTGGVAGKGFNLGIIDDPLSEQDAFSKLAKERVAEWYGPGFYTRRQPDHNAIVVMTTRWALDDLAGVLLARSKDQKDDPDVDQWDVLSIPAELNTGTAKILNRFTKDPTLSLFPVKSPDERPYRAGLSFAPRRWPLREIRRQRAQMSERFYNALYLQDPRPDEGGILPKKFWRKWKFKDPPECELVFSCYDTAFEEDEEGDFSARTTWGVFRHSDSGDPRDERYCLILLERMNEKLGFPDLRRKAYEHWKLYRPDRILIEKRATGAPLILELRRKNVPVSPWLPPGGSRYNKGKIPRAHAASVVLEQGAIFYMDREWAQEVIEQCANFPFDQHDDMVDTCTMAWIYLRRTFWLGLADETDMNREEIPDDEEGSGEPERRRLYG